MLLENSYESFSKALNSSGFAVEESFTKILKLSLSGSKLLERSIFAICFLTMVLFVLSVISTGLRLWVVVVESKSSRRIF